MTGFKSKKTAAQDKLAQPAQESKDRKRGSIALARSLCYQIAGAASEDDDISGSDYGSVDIAEILSAEVVRLQAALAQPAREPDVVMHWASHTWTTLNPPPKGSGNVNLYYAPPPAAPVQPAQERNFCERCGKRTADLTVIHTCTPPQKPNA